MEGRLLAFTEGSPPATLGMFTWGTPAGIWEYAPLVAFPSLPFESQLFITQQENKFK